MKALCFDRFGDAGVLEYRNLPDPQPGVGELLVRTRAIGLNFADVYRRQGNYHLQGSPPWVLGYEAAGVVEALGAGEILLTSMDRDGAKTGYDLQLLKAVSGSVGVPVIASGGAGGAQHMVDAVTQGGADAVLAASIFHFGEVSIGEVKAAMARAGIPVRLTEELAA